MEQWLRNRIDSFVDTLLGLGVVMAIMALPFSPVAKAGVLVSLPLVLYALLRKHWLAPSDDKSSEMMVPVDLYDPMPPPRVVPVLMGWSETPVGSAQTSYRQQESIRGRDDPCWCGSGRKYKKCHGK